MECKYWPDNAKSPHECCRVPEFYSQETKQMCLAICSSSTIQTSSWCCMNECLFNATQILVDGSFSNENAKKVFTKPFEKNATFIQLAIDAVDQCEADGTVCK